MYLKKHSLMYSSNRKKKKKKKPSVGIGKSKTIEDI